jgi:3-isopropylmalate/(R)-2-methylmalate dehydratase small subunit
MFAISAEARAAMEKFDVLTGVAAPLPMINIDTDKIIPKQYLTTVTRSGLGKGLFDELRYHKDGSEDPTFVLNREPYRRARILIADDNFGCGSSREHAPWALSDFGIRCVIAPTFADIFANNSAKNGILLVTLPRADVTLLLDEVAYAASAVLTVDLQAQTITRANGDSIAFGIEPGRKSQLLQGLDEISVTLQELDAIEAFERERSRLYPWL